jgi:CRISPR/Cas system-associated exonuclease Cas4 (RecB family)
MGKEAQMEYLSSSQINLYSQCSLKYRFQYVDLLTKPFKSSSLAFGSAIHSALSWFHRESMTNDKVPLEKLCKIFDADWYSQRTETDIRYKNGEEEMRLVVLAKEMLAMYYQLPPKKAKGTEVSFSVSLNEPKDGGARLIDLEGVIDLIEEGDVVTEFKTSAQMMDSRDADESLQLTIYSYAFEKLYRRPPKALKLVDFVKSKKPKLIVLETRRESDSYQRLYAMADQVLKGIGQKIFFPRSGFWCKDCEYAPQCQAWPSN